MDLLDVFFQSLIEWIYDPIKNRFGSFAASAVVVIITISVIYVTIRVIMNVIRI
jgi:hypothetical protein